MSTDTTRARPILFNGEMVSAILAGKKTQTRRVIKCRDNRWEVADEGDGTGRLWPYWPCYATGDPEAIPLACPYGEVGDRLWVRETFYVDDYRYPDGTPEEFLEVIDYKATHNCADWEAGCPCSEKAWRPSIHMPRWASRITLEITGVRVERLQVISDEDCWAEGLFKIGGDLETPLPILVCDTNGPQSGQAFAVHQKPFWTYAGSPRTAFQTIWDSINNPNGWCPEDATAGWDANPWVWVVEFRRLT